MICEKCGETINEGLKFCTKCGAKINDIAPGKIILMVTGILSVILAMIQGILVVVSTVALFQSIFNLDLDITISGGTSGFILSFIFGIIDCILYIIIGISGIKYSKDIDKAKILIFFAIILIAFYIVSLIITYSITKGFLWTSFIVFILPILFLIGALMNSKAKGEN